MLSVFAELEFEMIRGRTRHGLAAARAKCRQVGRPSGNPPAVRLHIVLARDAGASFGVGTLLPVDSEPPRVAGGAVLGERVLDVDDEPVKRSRPWPWSFSCVSTRSSSTCMHLGS